MILLPLVFAAATAVAPVISAERIREDVRVLASDEFEGRGPGETGDRRTVEFLSKAFAAAGLEPGGVDGLWTQPVPLVRIDRLPGATMSLTIAGKPMPLVLGKECDARRCAMPAARRDGCAAGVRRLRRRRAHGL